MRKEDGGKGGKGKEAGRTKILTGESLAWPSGMVGGASNGFRLGS